MIRTTVDNEHDHTLEFGDTKTSHDMGHTHEVAYKNGVPKIRFAAGHIHGVKGYEDEGN